MCDLQFNVNTGVCNGFIENNMARSHNYQLFNFTINSLISLRLHL